jgi:aquaporin Z
VRYRRYTAAAPRTKPRPKRGIEAVLMTEILRGHWPEYLMEAALLGVFMIAAAAFTWLTHHPASPLASSLSAPLLQRLATGVLMGATAICLVHTRWGRRSGAHMNPSFTIAFWRLGKVHSWDLCFYIAAQFAGAVAGIAAAAVVLGAAVSSPPVRYVATVPGVSGAALAFGGEAVISFVLMLTVLVSSNTTRTMRLTPWFVGVLIAAYITIESPLSGMSMNPARTFGPAFVGRIWDSLWIYFIAPPLGMLLASELFVRRCGTHAVWCAKLHHANSERCIFRCAHANRL